VGVEKVGLVVEQARADLESEKGWMPQLAAAVMQLEPV
jgi:hypothetical protein